MSFLGSILGAVAQVGHGIAKGVDEFAERTGAPPIIRGATGTLLAIAEAGVTAAEGMDGPGASVGGGGTGFLASAKEFFKGGDDIKAPAPEVGQKLGRSAAIHNSTFVAAAVTSPYDVSFDDIVPPSVGTSFKSSGIGIT